jgi:riboflavin synthase
MGIVEKLATNQRMVQWDGSVGEGVELTVRAKTALVDAYIGCSIAVNGVCLTAISYDDETVSLLIVTDVNISWIKSLILKHHK